ncbi:MAG: type II toxin-antitoxin system RelE/ParE family toxin [Gemmatimonadaceae bacterium]
MASYSVFIKPSAVKELQNVPLKNRRKLAARIRELAQEPRPHGCQKLSSLERYRIRHADSRAVYEIDDDLITVLVVKIGHRRDVYRK